MGKEGRREGVKKKEIEVEQEGKMKRKERSSSQ